MKYNIKKGRVVYSAQTYQVEFEVDGKEYTIRYYEDDNGAEYIVYDEEKGWEKPYWEDIPKEIQTIFNACSYGEFGDYIENQEMDLDFEDYD